MNNTKLSVTEYIINNIMTLLDKFNIEYKETEKYIKCLCPIHNGDDYNCCIYKDNAYNYGLWKCFSHGCHEVWGRSILNLFRGILSVRQNKNLTIDDIISFFLTGYSIDITKPVTLLLPEKIRKKTKAEFRFDYKRFTDTGTGLNRSEFRKLFSIPSEYFLKRGYSPAILDKYDVGDSILTRNSMFDRAVAPFYDQNFDKCVGVTGRSIYDKCLVCRQYHRGLCPTKSGFYSKWIFNDGFYCHDYFYNYWYAKGIIRSLEECILVEGTGDVWKMEDAGIRNSLGICGTSLLWNQILILRELGVKRVSIALDNDEAGYIAANRAEEQLKQFFTCKVIQLPRKDIGEMSKGGINKIFGR